MDSIKEKVSINTDPKQEFYDNDTDQEYESEVDETYDESKRAYSGGIVKIKNYSRSSQGNYQKDANYYQEPYNIPNVFPSPSLLATHAKEIQTYATTHTTIFCVALRDKHGYIKKFAFHSGATVMGPKLREKVQESGYDVIKAAQSHAEGQFIQFLRKRNKGNEQVYTHIIAMGCSRPHCKECDLVLRLLLGERYHQTTAAAKVVSNDVDLLQSIKLEPLDNAEYYIVKQERCTFKILKDVEAISDKSTPNYYVADLLKE